MIMEEKKSQVIFDKNAVEFVTVAAEFCGFLERVSDMRCRDFVDKSLKLLPLLYLRLRCFLLASGWKKLIRKPS